MVEKAPKHRWTGVGKVARVGLLGSMAPFLNTDITNPRELYAMLSRSRDQGGAPVASVKVGSKAGAKLPPLDTSAEVPFGLLEKQPQHNSFPDLATYRSEKGADRSLPNSVRRSSSLQELHSTHRSHTDTHAKKLKPILRDNTTKNVADHNEKAGVKFGEMEVRLIRDSPLPPIDGGGEAGLSFSSPLDVPGEEKAQWGLSRSPRHHRRSGAELSSEIFPRGQPVEVKRPATPTYNDYPEAYWELRSPTVQDPSDLKDDMIDRDRYRLQQISSLRLKAINHELAANKLDSYRKWQQHMLTNSPPAGTVTKVDSARGSATPSATGPSLSARNGKQVRTSAAVPNGTLAVAATSINPSAFPANKKRGKTTPAAEQEFNPDSHLTEDEFRRRQKIAAAARGDDENGGSEDKPVKATVVNLCIDPDSSNKSQMSDVYTGIRRIMFGQRPSSEKARTQESLPCQEGPAESVSAVSVKAILGSSQSHRLARVPSAPADSVGDASTPQGDVTDSGSSVASKKILRKFKQLQVFSEKQLTRENSSTELWNVVGAKHTEKSPYLPQNRPPTYKLDLRNYPRRHLSSRSRGGTEEAMGVIAEGPDGFPFVTNEHGLFPSRGNPSPAKSETTSINLRFRDGEVIISRQGKRPSAT